MFFLTNNVNSEEFSKLKISDNTVVLDVRTPAEYSQGKIEGAINISYPSSDFETKVKELSKEKKYLVYCRSGSRSTFACLVMKKLGYKNIMNLKGGLIDWSRNSKPLVR